MYKIFCKSYENYIKQYLNEESKREYRFNIAKPIELIADIEKYNKEKEKQSFIFKQLNDLLIYMQESIEQYPKFKAFLWTIESREIKGMSFGVSQIEDLKEQAKLVNMLLNLLYWDDEAA